ncbi:hypothetical protein [Polyangium aurulentum]|uniref:hypothetical protein n=1 Tax=Polyangium aurulentum TaxID=2567896 RepID=UPI00200CC60E|nr:hypothetical protein [Polyangium aurulentum]UQA57084.1 hypothetical protein E8A73_038205 [Polyangium aurulentum]
MTLLRRGCLFQGRVGNGFSTRLHREERLRSGSNWSQDAGCRTDTEDASEAVARRPARKAPRPELVTLDVAAAALGMEPGVGRAWRRKVRTRLRALERERGVSLCVVRPGRGGMLVRLDVLRQVAPLAFATADRVAELNARVSELESDLRQLRGLASTRPGR